MDLDLGLSQAQSVGTTEDSVESLMVNHGHFQPRSIAQNLITLPESDSIILPDWMLGSWSAQLDTSLQPLFANLDGPEPENHYHVPHRDAGLTEMSKPDSLAHSASFPSIKYPALCPLLPYLNGLLSPSVACGLLEAYLADAGIGTGMPSSDLILCHIFRRSSLLSTVAPRKCSPALLSSFLMIAAVSTETPFFGASPTARGLLLTRLYRLTVQLLDQDALGTNGRSTAHSADSFPMLATNSGIPGQRTPSCVDHVVTHLHLAIVASLPEIDAISSRWWHAAFQLAKEYRLNADVRIVSRMSAAAQGTSETPSFVRQAGVLSPPISVTQTNVSRDNIFVDGATYETENDLDVIDEMVVDRNDYRFAVSTEEELEERRRVWWSLYIWDKQVALSHNDAAAILQIDSHEVLAPAPDQAWQIDSFGHKVYNTTDQKVTGLQIMHGTNGMVQCFLPFAILLEDLLQLHLQSVRPELLDQSGQNVGNLLASICRQRIMDKTENLLQHFDRVEKDQTLGNFSCLQSTTRTTTHQRFLHTCSKFLAHVFMALANNSLDMLTSVASFQNTQDELTLKLVTDRTIQAADALGEMLDLGTHFNFKPMFLGPFLFHGSALATVCMIVQKGRSSPALEKACQLYLRAIESTISTMPMEYLVSSMLFLVLYKPY